MASGVRLLLKHEELGCHQCGFQRQLHGIVKAGAALGRFAEDMQQWLEFLVRNGSSPGFEQEGTQDQFRSFFTGKIRTGEDFEPALLERGLGKDFGERRIGPGQIFLNEQRRQDERVRVVLETFTARTVGGKVVARADGHAQQIMQGIVVFMTGEPTNLALSRIA